MALPIVASGGSIVVPFAMLNCTGRRKYMPYKTTSSGFTVTGELGSGTADATKFLRGDQAWQVPTGGGGAPVGAEYVVGVTHADLTAERLVTDTATVAWDLVTAGQAKANVPNDAITYAKIQNVSATDKVLGRATVGAGDTEEITCTAAGRALIDDADAAAQRSTLGLGALAIKSTVATADIDPDTVTYARLQNVSATARLLGRITAGAGDAEELTGTQTTTLLDNFTSTLKGLAPPSGGGTTNFLRADATWTAPAGGGGGGINTLRTAANQTINGTAFQNITGLTFAVSANTDYAFQFRIVFQSAMTTTGFRFGVSGPAGATLEYTLRYQTVANSTTAGVATYLDQHNTAYDSMTATAATITANVDLYATIEGRINIGGTAGTFAARVASELANNDLTVRKGSWGMWF